MQPLPLPLHALCHYPINKGSKFPDGGHLETLLTFALFKGQLKFAIFGSTNFFSKRVQEIVDEKFTNTKISLYIYGEVR